MRIKIMEEDLGSVRKGQLMRKGTDLPKLDEFIFRMKYIMKPPLFINSVVYFIPMNVLNLIEEIYF